MSVQAEARDRLLALQEGFAAGRSGDPGWLVELRGQAREQFAEQGLPDTRQEEWRYTSLAALARQRFEAAAHAPGRVARSDLEAVAFPVFACSLHVFVEGVHRPDLSAWASGSEARLASLAALAVEDPEALRGRLGALADTKRHPFAALNTAFLHDGARVRAPRGADLGEPLHLVFLSLGDGAARLRSPRLLVEAEEGSRVRLIVDHVALGAPGGLTNAVIEVFAGRNASVDLILLQREGSGSFHVSHVTAHQQRDSRFSCHTLSFGGKLVRNDLSVTLAEEGAECELRGLFVGGDDDVLDNHTLVDHAVPHGSSRELYKGILGGRSRGVFRGRVIVRPDAQKTDAQQSNPNLLLADGAEIDTKPQLEIYADDVKCSHGSAIGQLEPDALFYLRSRGIDERAARDLLTRGFASEILAGLPVAALAEGLDAELARALARASGREEPR